MAQQVGNRFAKENLMEMDPMLLRALLRERTHHTIEFKLNLYCKNPATPIPDTFGETVRRILDVWEERSLDPDCPDVLWARKMLGMAEKTQLREPVVIDGQMPRRLHDGELKLIDELIFTRRSIRNWTEESVPVEMVDDVIRAALWAPHACNLQTLRFAVIDCGDDPELFKCLEFEGHQVKIIVMQDMRAYEFYKNSVPERNRLLDCGAAVENMLLYAHALGLGAVWSTFAPNEAELIKTKLELPEYIMPITYVALGWSENAAIPPARIRVEDAVLYRSNML